MSVHSGTPGTAARITAVETAPVSVPVLPDLVVRGARGAHERSDFLLVRVWTSDDRYGYGEVSATPLWSGEDGTTADHLIRHVLAPALVGRPLAPVGALESTMDTVLAGNPFTKAGVAIALWDAYARTLGVPLAEALGGPYRTEIPIKLSLSGDGDALVRAHQAAARQGFGAFKVKVGFDPAADAERLRLARELAGTDAFLGVDANGGWSRSDAITALALLRGHRPSFVEQPVAAADLSGMRAVRQAAARDGTPVVADESVFGIADLVGVIEAEAADAVSVYVGKSGGPGRAVAMGRLASAFGLATIVGSNGELGIGAAAQVHVACALPELAGNLPSDIIGAHYYVDDILATPLDSDGRRVRLPAAAGLGVEPRPELVARLRAGEAR